MSNPHEITELQLEVGELEYKVAELELVLKGAVKRGGELIVEIESLKEMNAYLKELLQDARHHPQHSDYEWNLEFRKEVDRVLGD